MFDSESKSSEVVLAIELFRIGGIGIEKLTFSLAVGKIITGDLSSVRLCFLGGIGGT